MKTAPEIRAKRDELNQLRREIGQTMAQPTSNHSFPVGIVLAGFAAGLIVGRWGVRPVANTAVSANHWLGLLAPAVSPVLAMLHEQGYFD